MGLKAVSSSILTGGQKKSQVLLVGGSFSAIRSMKRENQCTSGQKRAAKKSKKCQYI